MRKLVEKINALPAIWHIIFVIIAFFNLAVPLFLFSFQDNLEKLEDLNDGLMAIDSPLSWENGRLNADSETIMVNDQYAVSIIDGLPEEEYYIYFAEDKVMFNVSGLAFDVDYSLEVEDRDAFFQEIVSAAQSNLILQGVVNFIIAFLFNGIIYLAILMGSKYFTKELYRNLFNYLTLPFVSVAIVTSLVSLSLNDYHLIIFFTAMLVIGTLTAYQLKDVIDKQNTSYYLGNEE